MGGWERTKGGVLLKAFDKMVVEKVQTPFIGAIGMVTKGIA